MCSVIGKVYFLLMSPRCLYWRDIFKECGRFCLEPKLYIDCCVFVSFPTTTDDEMFADSFKITESEDGIFYEVEGKVSRKMCTDNFSGLTPHLFLLLFYNTRHICASPMLELFFCTVNFKSCTRSRSSFLLMAAVTAPFSSIHNLESTIVSFFC